MIIDRETKTIPIMDSLGEDYDEAMKQVSNCIDKGVLEGYNTICASGAQQRDQISCGVHTSANIIEVICGDIKPVQGFKLPKRNEEEVIRLTGLLVTANEDLANVKRKENELSELAFNQKQSLKYALKNMGRKTHDVKEFLKELEKETPQGFGYEGQRSLKDFLEDFSMKYPRNKFSSWVKKKEFNDLIEKFPPLDAGLSKSLDRGLLDFFQYESYWWITKQFRQIKVPSFGREETFEERAIKKIDQEIKNLKDGNESGSNVSRASALDKYY
ncbi:hypothetical protein [Legionella anisa]